MAPRIYILRTFLSSPEAGMVIQKASKGWLLWVPKANPLKAPKLGRSRIEVPIFIDTRRRRYPINTEIHFRDGYWSLYSPSANPDPVSSSLPANPDPGSSSSRQSTSRDPVGPSVPKPAHQAGTGTGLDYVENSYISMSRPPQTVDYHTSFDPTPAHPYQASLGSSGPRHAAHPGPGTSQDTWRAYQSSPRSTSSLAGWNNFQGPVPSVPSWNLHDPGTGTSQDYVANPYTSVTRPPQTGDYRTSFHATLAHPYQSPGSSGPRQQAHPGPDTSHPWREDIHVGSTENPHGGRLQTGVDRASSRPTRPHPYPGMRRVTGPNQTPHQ
jgi:hypothetical protein